MSFGSVFIALVARTFTTPPLADAWNATNSDLFSHFHQKSQRQQWAEPVMGGLHARPTPVGCGSGTWSV